MEEKIKELIAQQLCLTKEDIELDMHLISELDFDEEAMLTMIMEIEQLYGIELDEIMLMEMDSGSDCFFFEDEKLVEDDEINLITVKDLILYCKMKLELE